MSNCAICVKVLKSNQLRLKCNDCERDFHASCLKMSKADVDCITTDNLVWRCCDCSSKRRTSMRLESDAAEGKLTLEDLMRVINEIREGQKANEKSFNAAYELMNNKIEENSKIMKEQNDKIDKCVGVIEDLISENKMLRLKVRGLEERVDDLEQYSRNNTLEIQGIPFEKNENVVSVVKEVGKALDMVISDDMIDACHRMGGRQVSGSSRPPGIIVKFVRRIDKEEFLQKRRVKRNLSTKDINRSVQQPIYVNESLSPARRKLWAQARDLWRDNRFKFLWIRGGKIFTRKEENAPVVVVRNAEDLSKL